MYTHSKMYGVHFFFHYPGILQYYSNQVIHNFGFTILITVHFRIL